MEFYKKYKDLTPEEKESRNNKLVVGGALTGGLSLASLAAYAKAKALDKEHEAFNKAHPKLPIPDEIRLDMTGLKKNLVHRAAPILGVTSLALLGSRLHNKYLDEKED